MKMNSHQLTVFMAVAKTGSFTKASESLYLTQPAVTQQIKLLEDELEVKLFDRIGKKTFLSAEGRRLFPFAEDILRKMEEAYFSLKDSSSPLKGSLVIGASYTSGSYLLPRYIKRLVNEFPDIFITVDTGNTKQIYDKVTEGMLDFGVVGSIMDSPKLICQELCTDELVLICSPVHPIAKKRKVHIKDLPTLPVVIRESDSGTWSQVNYLLSNHKTRLNPIIQVGSVEAVKHTVMEKIGVSIISRIAVEKEIKTRDLRAISLSPGMHRSFYLIHNKDKYINSIMKAFFENLSSYLVTLPD